MGRQVQFLAWDTDWTLHVKLSQAGTDLSRDSHHGLILATMATILATILD